MNRRLPRHLFAPLLLLLLVWGVFSVRNDEFMSTGNVYSVFSGSALYLMVALGLAITVFMAEGDVSVGSIAAVSAVMAVQLSRYGVPVAVVATTLTLTVVGALQGYVINRTRVNSLVFTIGSLILLNGASYLVAGNRSVSLHPDQFDASQAITDRILSVLSIFSLVALVAATATWLFLTYTRTGRELYALGGGRTEALAAGVRLRPKMIIAFATSAGFAAVGGALSGISAGGASPGGSESLLLTAVTAVLIGGVSITGGKGSVVGVVLGVLVVQSIFAGVAIEGVDSSVAQYLTAGLLVLVLAGEGFPRWIATARLWPHLHHRRSG